MTSKKRTYPEPEKDHAGKDIAEISLNLKSDHVKVIMHKLEIMNRKILKLIDENKKEVNKNIVTSGYDSINQVIGLNVKTLEELESVPLAKADKLEVASLDRVFGRNRL